MRAVNVTKLLPDVDHVGMQAFKSSQTVEALERFAAVSSFHVKFYRQKRRV